ncbi:MAG: hypothetical protein MJ180_02415 [Candidatus Gastranaerophilales bacterium]|nr:hypothetical protein [Candidatus Gastranaerophilales bacterium]
MMVIKEFFRKLNIEVAKREKPELFTLSEFYFLDNHDEHEDLEVGETYVSVTGLLDLK